MLRVQTSFQDCPDDDTFNILVYNGQELDDQAQDLGLKEGDTVILWDPDCGDYTVEATLLFAHQHWEGVPPALWARRNAGPM